MYASIHSRVGYYLSLFPEF